MKKILGIDIRENVVKLAEIKKNNKGYSLEKWGSSTIPINPADSAGTRDNALSKALSNIIKSRKIRTRKAVAAISGPDVIARRISLPKMPQAEVRHAAKFKVEKIISYSIDDAIFDIYPVIKTETSDSKEEEMAEYVLTIAKKDTVTRIINICKNAGARIHSISIIPIALEAAFSDLLTDETASIIYMGQYSTNICIFKRKEFAFMRDVAIGGETITRAMSGAVSSEKGVIELSSEEAEKIKIKEGIPINFEEYSQRTGIPAINLSAMMRPAIEKIEAEILRSFEYFGSPVSKIILTGGSAETKGLIDILSNALKIGIEKGIPKISTRHIDIPSTPLAVAIGTAIEEGKKINLLTEEYKHPLRNLSKKLVNFMTLGTAFGLILLIALGWYFYKSKSLSNELAILKREASNLGITFSGDQTIEKTDDAFFLSFNSPGTDDIFVEIMNALGNLISANIALNKIGYDYISKSVSIDGTFKKSLSEDGIAAFMQNLKKSKMFSSIDLTSIREASGRRTQGYEFKIKCTIVQKTNK